ncbi:MAG: L-2-amino-thiazoline-4-carboxylic acid hydrolase [Oscillospiraceae bacterium]|nr:L-2-amino-thiazoline-4-carboxylic acid hydrolase [Oscillospiraceae bacterium]
MKKRKNSFLDEISVLIDELYAENHATIMAYAWSRFDGLCAENADESKAVQMHTRSRIYPAISVFEALVNCGVGREDAAQLILDFYITRAQKPGKVIQKLLKIPGLYKAVPNLFLIGVNKMFGPDAGFKARHYESKQGCFRMDMLECPYMSICKKYGCPEIVPAFCASDDVAYGNMHPKLIWGRTKTLGRGDECCDFKLTVK